VPTLLGYLLALVILLGGGYTALEWLTSGDYPTSYQRPDHKWIAKNRTAQKSALNAASGTADRQPPEALLDKTSSADAPKGTPIHDEPKAKDTDDREGSNDHTDAVPTGGCMPIGLTAQGEMVFPIQCRTLIERERGSLSPPMATAAVPSTAHHQGANEESETSEAGVHYDAGSKSALDESVTGDRSNERIASNDRAPKDSVEQGQEKTGQAVGPSPDETKQSLDTPDAFGRSNEVRKRQVESRRSRLVTMTLRTIEYPDGRRVRFLLPLNRSKKRSLQAQARWYNALGLR
jgi:hypothetical protein